MSKKIKESVDNIRKECDEIEAEVEEEKKGNTHGDPICEFS